MRNSNNQTSVFEVSTVSNWFEQRFGEKNLAPIPNESQVAYITFKGIDLRIVYFSACDFCEKIKDFKSLKTVKLRKYPALNAFFFHKQNVNRF